MNRIVHFPENFMSYIWDASIDGDTKEELKNALSVGDFYSVVKSSRLHKTTEWILRGQPLYDACKVACPPWGDAIDIDFTFPHRFVALPRIKIVERVTEILDDNDQGVFLKATNLVEFVSLCTPDFIDRHLLVDPNLCDDIAKYKDYVDGRDPLYVPDLDDNVRELLTMVFGIALGQHLDESESSVRHGMPISTACMGATETGKGTFGEVAKRLLCEWKRELPNTRNGPHATAELRRPDNASLFTVGIISDMKDPLESLLPFRQMNDGFTGNPKHKTGFDTSAMGPEFIKAHCPALIIAGQMLEKIIQSPLPSKAERYTDDVSEAICRRIMGLIHHPITWERNDFAKEHPLINCWQLHFLTLFCHCWRLTTEMRRRGVGVTSIFPEVHKGGEEPCEDGLLKGWSRILMTECMKARDSLLTEVNDASPVTDFISSHVEYAEGQLLNPDYVTKSIRQVTRQNNVSNNMTVASALKSQFPEKVEIVGVGRSGQSKRRLVCVVCQGQFGKMVSGSECTNRQHKKRLKAVITNASCTYEYVDQTQIHR